MDNGAFTKSELVVDIGSDGVVGLPIESVRS